MRGHTNQQDVTITNGSKRVIERDMDALMNVWKVLNKEDHVTENPVRLIYGATKRRLHAADPLTPRFEKQITDIKSILKKVLNVAPIGKGGGGEANLYTLTVSHGKTDRVVVKTPLGGHIDSVKHEARIAHRLRDGMVWAAMREPWEPLQNINGSQYNRIADEVRIMHAGGGYDNIHQFLAFVSPATLPPLGGLISTRAEGNIAVSAALYAHPLAPL